MAGAWIHLLVLSEWGEGRLQLEIGPGVHADWNYARDGHAVASPPLDQVDLLVVLVRGQVKVVNVLPTSPLQGYEPFQCRLLANVRLTVLVVCWGPNPVLVSYVRVSGVRVVRRIKIVTTWGLVDAVGAAFEGLRGPHHVDGGSCVCEDVPAGQTVANESF